MAISKAGPTMRNALIARLQALRHLGPEAQMIITSHSQCPVTQRAELSRESVEATQRPFFLLDGLACLSRYLGNGQRQIVALLTPGTAVNIFASANVSPKLVYEFLTPCKICMLSDDALDQIISHPELREALEMYAEVSRNIAYEWITNNGRRLVERSICHLLCELLVQYKLSGVINWQAIGIPLTQAELSDIFGKSVVHINQSIKSLRERKIIKANNGRRLLECDFDAMAKFCLFDSYYLGHDALP